jgi:hypothetical protein
MNVTPVAVLLAASFATAACTAKPPPLESKRCAFHVTGDPGSPVAGTELTVAGRVVGTTDARGVALVTLQGHEGETFDVGVRCPSDFQSPRAQPVTLHKLAGDAPTEYDATCRPKARSVVLAVNGMKGYRLPIVRLGQTIGETDESGVATLLLHVEPDESFEVTLDTSAPENAQLRPRNPTATFTTKNVDEVLVFDPQLSVVAKPRPAVARVHAPTKVVPLIPVRIQ